MGKLSQSEFNRQKGIIEGHLIPFFGSKQLASIRRKDVAEYIDMLTGAGGDGTIIKEVNVLKRYSTSESSLKRWLQTLQREPTCRKPWTGASVSTGERPGPRAGCLRALRPHQR